MIDFMNWVKEIFSSINPYTHEAAMASLKDFMKKHGSVNFLMPSPLPFLAQGDVLDGVFFSYLDDDGNQSDFMAPGMLLSNTCDADRENTNILFVPLIPMAEYIKEGLNETTIRKNLYTDLFYIPDPPLSDYVIDFSIISSISRDLVIRAIEKGIMNKMSSFNLKGYYFLLSKATVHVMRPESLEVKRPA
jgi:hypothetical protein